MVVFGSDVRVGVRVWLGRSDGGGAVCPGEICSALGMALRLRSMASLENISSDPTRSPGVRLDMRHR